MSERDEFVFHRTRFGGRICLIGSLDSAQMSSTFLIR
jgi:hypothetical protein